MTGRGENPFEPPGPERPAPTAGLPDGLPAIVAAGRTPQIVGPNGSGKSTLLGLLADWLATEGQPVRVDRVSRGATAPAPPPAGWWLLDEAQWLSPAALRTLAAGWAGAGRRLALATHIDLRRWLRPLAVVTWRVPLLGDGAAVQAFAARYLAAARVAPAEWPLSPAAAARLRRRSGGNARVLLALLYELWETVPVGSPVLPATVDEAAATLRREAPGLLDWRRREREHRP